MLAPFFFSIHHNDYESLSIIVNLEFFYQVFLIIFSLIFYYTFIFYYLLPFYHLLLNPQASP